MKWLRRFRLWLVTLRLPHRLARVQHEQAIEQSGIVDEVKGSRRAITHQLADEVLKLDAVMDRLDETTQPEGGE